MKNKLLITALLTAVFYLSGCSYPMRMYCHNCRGVRTYQIPKGVSLSDPHDSGHIICPVCGTKGGSRDHEEVRKESAIK